MRPAAVVLLDSRVHGGEDRDRLLDADVLAIEEGPSRPAELALLIQDYLSDQNGQLLYEFFLSYSGAQQKLGFL
jgi:hypothetical protein